MIGDALQLYYAVRSCAQIFIPSHAASMTKRKHHYYSKKTATKQTHTHSTRLYVRMDTTSHHRNRANERTRTRAVFNIYHLSVVPTDRAAAPPPSRSRDVWRDFYLCGKTHARARTHRVLYIYRIEVDTSECVSECSGV